VSEYSPYFTSAYVSLGWGSWQLAEVVASMTTELETEQAELIQKEKEHNERVITVSTLSEAISNHGRDRENRLLALEKEIKSLKKEVASVSKEFKVTDH